MAFTAQQAASGSVSFEGVSDKLAGLVYLLNTSGSSVSAIQSGAKSFFSVGDKLGAVIYLLNSSNLTATQLAAAASSFQKSFNFMATALYLANGWNSTVLTAKQVEANSVAYQYLSDKQDCVLYVLSGGKTAAQVAAGARAFANLTNKNGIILYLLANRSSFVPSSLGSVKAEFDANFFTDFTFSDGFNIATWKSRDAATTTITQADGSIDPTWQPNVFGKNAAVNFLGNHLSAAVNQAEWTMANLTIFFFGKPFPAGEQLAANPRYISFEAGGCVDFGCDNAIGIYNPLVDGNKISLVYNNTTPDVLPTDDGETALSYGLRLKSDGTTRAIVQQSGGSPTVLTDTCLINSIQPDMFNICGNSEPNTIIGQFAYFIIFYRALSDAEMTQVINYMDARFT
jgi:hypothetical protein